MHVDVGAYRVFSKLSTLLAGMLTLPLAGAKLHLLLQTICIQASTMFCIFVNSKSVIIPVKELYCLQNDLVETFQSIFSVLNLQVLSFSYFEYQSSEHLMGSRKSSI